MKSIGFTRHLDIDNPESLIDFETVKPTSKGHDLLVNTSAISVKPVDIGVRKSGEENINQPKIIDWDACGIVSEVREDEPYLNQETESFMQVLLFV